MSNLYKTPESQLINEADQTITPHVFWKIYFWVITPLTLLSLLGILFLDNLNLFDYIDMAVYLILLFGLYGYAFSKKIGAPVFWKIVFYIFSLWFIFYSIIAPFILDIPQYGEPAVFDGWLVLHILDAPVFIFLYLYSFKADYLWKP